MAEQHDETASEKRRRIAASCGQWCGGPLTIEAARLRDGQAAEPSSMGDERAAQFHKETKKRNKVQRGKHGRILGRTLAHSAKSQTLASEPPNTDDGES